MTKGTLAMFRALARSSRQSQKFLSAATSNGREGLRSLRCLAAIDLQGIADVSSAELPVLHPSRSSAIAPSLTSLPFAHRCFSSLASTATPVTNAPRIDVASFILENYKPYNGDDSFLAGPTDRTKQVCAMSAMPIARFKLLSHSIIPFPCPPSPPSCTLSACLSATRALSRVS